MALPGVQQHVAPRDWAYAALRATALALGAAWTSSLEPSQTRDGLLAAFALFVPYCGVLYLAGWRLLRSAARDTFYLVAAVSDFVFVAALVHASGGARGPLVAAFWLWSATYASYFGLRGGGATSVVALGAAAAFGLAAHLAFEPWRAALAAALAVATGPLLGFLFDAAGAEGRSLRAARDDLAGAHRKLVEEQTRLIEEEKHRSIAVLAAGIAHEINNPLTGIMQCARALSEDTLPEERKKDYVAAILEGVGRLKSVVEGVRDYARQRPAIPNDLDAADAVASCVRMIAPVSDEAGVRVASSVRPGRVRIRAEANQLRKALGNVVLNAVYFSPRGDEVTISATRRGYRWGIAVADHGPGISKENLSKVTHPFFTTKPPGEGTGLGLAIVYGVMRSFGGELEISSESGHGTTVTLWLPAAGGAHA